MLRLLHKIFDVNRDFALRNFSRQQRAEEKVPAKSTASSHDILKNSGGSSQISMSHEKSGLNTNPVERELHSDRGNDQARNLNDGTNQIVFL